MLPQKHQQHQIFSDHQPPPRGMGKALVVTKPSPYQILKKAMPKKMSGCGTGRSSLTAENLAVLDSIQEAL